MEKNCCTINVTELSDGFRIEVKGEGVKEKCRNAMHSCCSQEGVKKYFHSFCGGSKNEGDTCC